MARQVLAVLRNPVYIGRFADRDTSRHGVHEAIGDPEILEMVQGLLASRRTTTQPRRRAWEEFFLRQKIVCPQCGRFLTTYTGRRKVSNLSSIVYRYQARRSTVGGRPRCKGVQYPA